MWPFNRTEIRESSFTDALVSQIVARAGGAVSARPTATGALEACAGLVGRAFSAASVEGPPMLTRISILALARSQDTPPLRRIPRLFALNPAHHLRR